MRAQQLSNHLRERVDVVPPRATHDHLLEHRHQVRRPAVAMSLQRGQPDRDVALLAITSAAPQLEDRGLPFIARRKWIVREDLPTYGIHLRSSDAVVGHLRFHERLHPHSSAWIRDSGQFRTQMPGEPGLAFCTTQRSRSPSQLDYAGARKMRD